MYPLLLCGILVSSALETLGNPADTSRAHEMFSIGISHHTNRDYKESGEFLAKARKEFRDAGYPDREFTTIFWLTIVHRNLSDWAMADHWVQELMEVCEEVNTEDSIYYGRALSVRASVFTAKEMYEKALEDYRVVLRIRVKAYGEVHKQVSKIYNHFGMLNLYLSEFELAAEYFTKALQIDASIFGEHSLKAAIRKFNLGWAYRELKQYEEAIDLIEEALAVFQANEKPGYCAECFNELGLIYRSLGESKLAYNCHSQANKLYRDNRPENHPNLSLATINFGRAAADLGKTEEALDLYHEALYWSLQNFNPPSDIVSDTYNRIGEVYFKEEEYGKAYSAFRASVLYAASPYDTVLFPDLPPLEMISTEFEPFEALLNKARLEWRLANGNADLQIKYLSDAFNTCHLGIQLIERKRYGYQAERDKHLLFENFYGFYEEAVLVSWELYRLTQDEKWFGNGFAIAEKSKSLSLREGLIESDLKFRANVPQVLLDLELKLQENILELEHQLNEAETRGDSRQIILARDLMVKERKEYADLLFFLKDQYPRYFNFVFNSSVSSWESIQSSLPEAGLFLEYFATDSSILVFGIARDEILFELLPQDRTFRESIEEIGKQFDKRGIFQNQESSFLRFVSSSSALYERLLQPVLDQLDQSPIRIIVVPDGPLASVPFEALLTSYPTEKDPGYSDLNYLVHDYIISYAHSGTVMTRQMRQERKKYRNHRILVLSPDYSMQPEILDLEGLQQESRQILGQFQGSLLEGADASEKNFADLADQYPMVHICAHAISDSVNSYNSKILFTQTNDSLFDDTLYTHEVLNLNFKAPVMVLSACQTGNGPEQKGEGVLSLARAFIHAGSPAVVCSLWDLPDESAVVLMEHFYTGIAEGLPMDLALQRAKQKYIEQEDDFGAHPLFWASIVAMGDMAPVELTRRPAILRDSLMLAGILAFSLLFLFVVRSVRAK